MDIKKVLQGVKTLIKQQTGKGALKSGIGIAVFVLFVFSSLLVNQTVQALNQAAGNYGYYSGTYGYNESDQSSDQVPSAPTSLSCSASSTSAGTCSWTAPTTTTDSTSLDNLDHYHYNYATSSVTSCTGGTGVSSATFSLSGLTQNTTYYVAVCAVDTNSNEGSVATSSFTTQSYSGGGSSGGVANNTLPTPTPTTTTTTTTPTVATPSVPTVTTVATVADGAQLATQMGVVRNTTLEASSATKVASSAAEFKVTISAEVKTVAANFVTYGTSPATVALGSGERLAVVRDVLEILGTKVSSNASALLTVADQIANGQKPTIRNLTKEQIQVPQVLKNFEKLVGHRPNFKNAKEDLAWNTLQYRVRFARNLEAEKVGIVKFKAVLGKTPKTPLDWATVRAWGYALK